MVKRVIYKLIWCTILYSVESVPRPQPQQANGKKFIYYDQCWILKIQFWKYSRQVFLYRSRTYGCHQSGTIENFIFAKLPRRYTTTGTERMEVRDFA